MDWTWAADARLPFLQFIIKGAQISIDEFREIETAYDTYKKELTHRDDIICNIE